MAYEAVIQEFSTYDEQWAKQFVEDPIAFANKIAQHATLKQLHASSTLPLIGGQSLLLSYALAPNEEMMKKVQTAGGHLKMNVNSSNAAFVVYDTCCPEPHNMMFLKVALDDYNSVDFIEVESLALKLIRKYMPAHLKKYYMTYSAAAQVFVSWNGRELSIPLDDYKNGSVLLKKTGPSRISIPAIFTRAVPSGISLHSIVKLCINNNGLALSRGQLDTMHLFFGKDKTQKYVSIMGVINARHFKNMQRDLLVLFNEFACGVLQGCKHMHMSHGDLHLGNILFDALKRCFVMIDYGRTYINMDALKADPMIAVNEMLKVQSHYKSASLALNVNRVKKDFNTFYEIYDNFNMRAEYDYPRLAQWSFLIDFAGLCTSLFLHFQNYKTEFLQHKGTTKLHIYKYDHLKQWFNANHAKLEFFEYGLVMFALIFHALLRIPVLFSTLQKGVNTTHAKYIVVNINHIIDENHGFFYTGSATPSAAKYYLARTMILDVINDFGLIPALEAALARGVQTGGSSSNHETPINDMKLIRKLTRLNYLKRSALRRYRRQHGVKYVSPLIRRNSDSVHVQRRRRQL